MKTFYVIKNQKRKTFLEAVKGYNLDDGAFIYNSGLEGYYKWQIIDKKTGMYITTAESKNSALSKYGYYQEPLKKRREEKSYFKAVQRFNELKERSVMK